MPNPSTITSSLSPEYALLGLLWQQPAHGYELHQRLTTDLGQVWHISLSQTYNILNRLEAQRLIAGTLQEQAKLPARRQFRLTAAGRRRFEAWLHTPAGLSARAIRVEFLTRLYFAQTVGVDDARAVIDAQLAAIQSGLERLNAILVDLPEEQVFNRLGLDLRIRQLTSILSWLEDCREALS